MRKKKFNPILPNEFEKFIVIAVFYLFGVINGAYAAASVSTQANPIAALPPTIIAPMWGKLVLVGNTVTCYCAQGTSTPTTWTQIGTPQTINFINNPILVGMYVTSHNTAAVASGTIDNFSITPTPTYRLTDYDIGAPPLMGSANLISGVWNLSGSGADIWGTSDQGNFQSWLVWGDCTVICRITSLSAGNVYEKIGIMIRDGFNSGSDYALFGATFGSGLFFQYRYSFNNNPDITQFVAPPAPGVKSGVAVGYGLTGGTTYTLRP
jgi:hypothetical protein